MTELPRYFRYPRADVVELVPRDRARVLDVGCAAGLVGEALKLRQRCEVVGIEREPHVAAEARRRLDDVIELDLEDASIDWTARLGAARFDCLIYADVLEHLRDPWSLLAAQRALLAPGGVAVVSVPNVRHYEVVLGLLLRGRWRYQDEGVLDRTHLRFFTRASLAELLGGAGYRVSELRREIHASRAARWVGGLCSRASRDFLARQFLVLAVPTHDAR